MIRSLVPRGYEPRGTFFLGTAESLLWTKWDFDSKLARQFDRIESVMNSACAAKFKDWKIWKIDMKVSEIVVPKSSILIGFSIINHPFWGAPIFGNTHSHDPWCDLRNPRGASSNEATDLSHVIYGFYGLDSSDPRPICQREYTPEV